MRLDDAVIDIDEDKESEDQLYVKKVIQIRNCINKLMSKSLIK